MSKYKFTVGCDPEWFLRNSDDKPVSAIGKFEGDKEHPVQLERGVSVQVDNCAVEYGISPASSLNEWMDRNTSAKQQIAEIAAAQGLKLLIEPSVVFPETELDDPRAWIFGCDPDFNAWTKEWNPRPQCDNPFLRSAGGHIHIGARMLKRDAPAYAKALDMFVAVPGLLVDADDRRRLLYGKAGAMRFKPYGMEWRTGSNFWTTSEQRLEWVYRAVSKAITFVKEERSVPTLVRHIIDNGDRVMAASFCEMFHVEVPQ